MKLHSGDLVKLIVDTLAVKRDEIGVVKRDTGESAFARLITI